MSFQNNVARIAELLRSPRSRVTELCQETTDEKGMFYDVGGRRAETGMIGCQLAVSCFVFPRSSCWLRRGLSWCVHFYTNAQL